MEVSQDEDELLIYRDKNGIIKVIHLSVKMIYLKTVVNQIYLNCPYYLNNFLCQKYVFSCQSNSIF